MTIEQWRAAAIRWADPLLGLALLITPQRVSAEAITVAVLANTLPQTPPAELEDALYSALWQHSQRRGRRPAWFPRSTLPRELARLAAPDRLLVGLWLLRGLDGARLAAAVDQPPAVVAKRLAAALSGKPVQPPADGSTAGHPTLEDWIAYQLGLAAPDPQHPRPCRECQVAQASWHSARDHLRQLLREVARPAQLSLARIDELEDTLDKQQHTTNLTWLGQRRVWLAALLGAVGLALVLMVSPRDVSDSAQAPPVVEAHALVQAALEAWTAPTAATHLRVRARDSRLHGGQPVVTDIWLGEPGSARHRVEVHRDGALVEWQVADGRSRFNYGAAPSDSSCRWNTGWQGSHERLERRPVRFDVMPEQQRVIRDMRLMQGAYGLGYFMLEQALAAEDLRSFGMRVQDSTSLLLLQFTDTQTQPERQIVLRIDPQRGQLHVVQEVQTVNSQAISTDLWRLELSEPLETDFDLRIPAGPPPLTPQRLVDPGCPALNTAYLISLRTLLNIARPSYVPAALPPGISKIALLSNEPRTGSGGRAPQDLDSRFVLQLVGPGRWFSLSNSGSTQNSDRSADVPVGAWQVALNGPTTGGIWSGTLRLRINERPGFGQVFEFWARGWSREQLQALIGSLEPLDPALWLALDNALLDPEPLPTALQATLTRAIQALQPLGSRTVHSSSSTTVRVGQDFPELADPYHVPRDQRYPATLQRQQWLIYQDGRVRDFHERRTLPDGTLYELLQSEGERFHWYSSHMQQTYTGSSALLRAVVRPDQTALELISALMASSQPITLTESATGLVLEQTVAAAAIAADDRGGPQLAHTPWLGGLFRDTADTFVQQLRLDPATYRPQSFAIVLRQPDGGQTLVRETTITDWQVVAAPPTDLFSLSTIPETAFTINITAGPSVPQERVTPPQRVLAWPAELNVNIVDRALPLESDIGAGSLNSHWADIQNVRGTFTTIYQLDRGAEVRMVQGPHYVVQHVLRNQYFSNDNLQIAPWSSSRRLPVTVAGQEREAWLLQNNDHSVLVVQVDDLALHFSGPALYLTDDLPKQLPRLEWQAVPQEQ